MTTITYHHRDGQQTVEALDGESVMRAAVRAGVPGIVGQCGGQAVCATCHVNVEAAEAGLAGLPEPNEDEDDTLDGIAGRQETSRLSCQLVVDQDVGSLTVTVADAS